MGYGCHDDWGGIGWCASVDTRQEGHMEVWEKTRENMRKVCFIEPSRLIDASYPTITSGLLMDRQQPRRRIPEIQLRVLIVGRANAGKTSILQRVCETTESPIIYRRRLGAKGPVKVRGSTTLSIV